MSRLSVRSPALLLAALLALPLAAAAEPVRIVSHSQGMLYPEQQALGALELIAPVRDPVDVPFSLQLDSLIDPASPDFVASAYGVRDRSSMVSLSFQVGDLALSYAGPARASIIRYSDGQYQHSLSFTHNFYNVSLTHIFNADPALLGDGFLAPRSFSSDDGAQAVFELGVSQSNPDGPSFPSVSVRPEFAALSVTSPVPEPAPASLFALGLLACALPLGRRLRRG